MSKAEEISCVHCAHAATRGSILPPQVHHYEAPHESLQGASVHGREKCALSKVYSKCPFLKILWHHNLLHQYCETICDSNPRNESFPSSTVLSVYQNHLQEISPAWCHKIHCCPSQNRDNNASLVGFAPWYSLFLIFQKAALYAGVNKGSLCVFIYNYSCKVSDEKSRCNAGSLKKIPTLHLWAWKP